MFNRCEGKSGQCWDSAECVTVIRTKYTTISLRSSTLICFSPPRSLSLSLSYSICSFLTVVQKTHWKIKFSWCIFHIVLYFLLNLFSVDSAFLIKYNYNQERQERKSVRKLWLRQLVNLFLTWLRALAGR